MHHLAAGVRCTARLSVLRSRVQPPIRIQVASALCNCGHIRGSNRRNLLLPLPGPVQAAGLASWPPPHLRPYVPKQGAASGRGGDFPDDATTPDSKRPAVEGMGSKFPQFLREYGATGVITHFSLSAVWYTSFYLAIKNGVDIEAVLATVGLSPPSSDEGSAAVMAFVAYKLCQPLRFGVTVVVTPIVVRALRRSGHAGWPLPPKK